MNDAYVLKQTSFYQISIKGNQTHLAKDALWRIASYLEGLLDGISGVGDELTAEQTDFVLGYLRDEGYLLDHIFAEFEKPLKDEPVDDSSIPDFIEFLAQ